MQDYWITLNDRNEALTFRSLTKDKVVTAFDEWLLPCGNDGKQCHCRALVVQVIGNGGEASAEGRPNVVDSELIPAYVNEQVRAVHASVVGATWGKGN